ncbi:MAG TPA: isoaspartyl peptidase/L-asparaginase [Ktedonobacteraceae bacterium]
MPISIVVHGGAGDLSSERQADASQGCQEAALIGWHVLQSGGSALDAVEAAVRALEDNPAFNAGTGSCLTAEGHIELDAGMMDGRTLDVGAVAGVQLLKNPISLARELLTSPHVLLVGRGAEQFANEQGIARCTFADLLTERQYQLWKKYLADHALTPDSEPQFIRREIASLTARDEQKHGTVGAVAVDSTGALAAGTSTGGLHNKYPGRIGDSPLIGGGFYADEEAAISCTGHGEDFARLLIAKRAADYVAQSSNAQQAATAAIAFLASKATGTGGLIVVDRHGNIGYAQNSQNMAYAYMTEKLDQPAAGV